MHNRWATSCRKICSLAVCRRTRSKNKLSKRKLLQYLKNKDFANVLKHGLIIREQLQSNFYAETIVAILIDKLQKLTKLTDDHENLATFNPVIVDFYEQVGYLPHAIINYLVLLVGR